MFVASLQEVYDRGFSAMERSHQKVIIEMRKTHRKDLDQLRQEKDQLLTEETKATQAALDAMRKAHESELQKERNKFLDLIAKTYSQIDVESLQKQHEEDLELIQSEISKLSEQFSIKCLENAALEERMDTQTRTLNECRHRITDLMTRNEELNLVVKYEIDRLSKLIKQKIPPEGHSPLRKDGESAQVYDLRELEDTLEKYQSLYNQTEAQRMSYQREVEELKIRLERLTQARHAEGATADDLYDRRSRSTKHIKKVERQEGEGRSGSDESDDLSPDRGSVPETDSEAGSDVRSRSPSPKHSKLRPSSPDGGATTQIRQLPKVPMEARNVKKALWRQRQPQRSRSSPGLTSSTQLTLAKLTRPNSDIKE
jgi:myosin heavy subunit